MTALASEKITCDQVLSSCKNTVDKQKLAIAAQEATIEAQQDVMDTQDMRIKNLERTNLSAIIIGSAGIALGSIMFFIKKR